MLLVDLLLDRSGYRLHARRGEDLNVAVEDTMVLIADGVLSFPEIEHWFKSRIRKKRQ